MQQIQYLKCIMDMHGLNVIQWKVRSSQLTSPKHTYGVMQHISPPRHKFILLFIDPIYPPTHVTKGQVKPKFVWMDPQQKAFKELKHCLYMTPIVIILDL